MEEKERPLTFSYHDELVNLRAPEVRLDLESPLEMVLLLSGLLSGVACFIIPIAGYPLWYIGVALLAAVVLLTLRTQVDCTYLLDNVRQRIDYSRTILGFTTRYPVCRFDQIHMVTAKPHFSRSQHHSYWDYTVVIILKYGEVVRVADPVRDDCAKANRNAKALAQHLGAPFQEGPERQLADIGVDKWSGQVSIEPDTSGPSPLFVVGMAIICLAFAALFWFCR